MVACLVVASGLLTAPTHREVNAAEPVLFGASARARGGQTQHEAVENLEAAIGRTLAAVRVYKRWDHSFPTRYDQWLQAGGRTLVLSVAPQRANGQLIPWRDIADAPIGSDLHKVMASWARRIRDFESPVYFIFSHEPETENPNVMGTKQDFIDAWRRIVTVFRNHHVDNVRFTLVLTAYTYARTDGNGAWSWYPGDDVVDVIGADGYNFYGCRPGVAESWRPFSQIFEPVRAFAAAHPGKGALIAEWGSVEDPGDPGRKADWISGAQATLSSPGWEQFEAVLYWHSESPMGNPPCEFWVDTSSSSLSAFRSMGADPRFFSGAPPQISGLAPTKGPVGTDVTIEGINFTAVQGVTFDGTPADFSVDGLSRITASVPPGATGGAVAVTTSFGTATGPTFRVVHRRTVSFSVRGDRAAGRVVVLDGFERCGQDALVRIQRRNESGGWRTVLQTLTHADGSYRAPLPDRPGRYRARLPRSAVAGADICGNGVSGSRVI